MVVLTVARRVVNDLESREVRAFGPGFLVSLVVRYAFLSCRSRYSVPTLVNLYIDRGGLFDSLAQASAQKQARQNTTSSEQGDRYWRADGTGEAAGG